MAIERVNQSFIEVRCEGGLRTLVKIGAIQIAAENDATGSDITMCVGNQSYTVLATIDELREALEQDAPFRVFRRAGI